MSIQEEKFPPTEMTPDQFDSRLCMLQFDGPSHEKIVIHDHSSLYLYIRDTDTPEYYVLVYTYEVSHIDIDIDIDIDVAIIDIVSTGKSQFAVRIETASGRTFARAVNIVNNTMVVS